MAVLSYEDKARAVGHLQAGVSVTDVAKRFNCSRPTIHALKKKYAAFGTVSRKPWSGRRESITQATKDMIVVLHERDPFRSAVNTSKELNVSRFKGSPSP